MSGQKQQVTIRQCADCTAVGDRRGIEHEPSCPLGRAIDAVVDRDREYFATRPLVRQYWRAVHPAEVAELTAAGIVPAGARVIGQVRVVQLRPGIRARDFAGVVVLVGGGTR